MFYYMQWRSRGGDGGSPPRPVLLGAAKLSLYLKIREGGKYVEGGEKVI